MANIENITGRPPEVTVFSRAPAVAPASDLQRQKRPEKSEPSSAQQQLLAVEDAAKAKAEPSESKELSKRAAQVLETLILNADSNVRLTIQRDDSTGRFIYRGIDKNTGEVVQQFPAEATLAYLRQVRDNPGLLLDAEV
jgi:uncharacterized FlaG/YvyC family protein